MLLTGTFRANRPPTPLIADQLEKTYVARAAAHFHGFATCVAGRHVGCVEALVEQGPVDEVLECAFWKTNAKTSSVKKNHTRVEMKSSVCASYLDMSRGSENTSTKVGQRVELHATFSSVHHTATSRLKRDYMCTEI